MSSIQEIESNIQKFGHHVYLILGGSSPRYSYTIGNHGRFGYELIFAGGTYYSGDEVHQVLNAVTQRFLEGTCSIDAQIIVGDLGLFTLVEVESSWSSKMVLGALEYYRIDTLKCLQVLPEEKFWTIDIPDLTRKLDVVEQPVWKWFSDGWPFPVSPGAIVTTNLDALRGYMVTEAARWEPELWELFSGSGPDVAFEEIRCVPLATLIAFDPSLEVVVNLAIEEAIWRDPDENLWHKWSKKSS